MCRVLARSIHEGSELGGSDCGGRLQLGGHVCHAEHVPLCSSTLTIMDCRPSGHGKMTVMASPGPHPKVGSDVRPMMSPTP
jgi:hypothetical protein